MNSSDPKLEELQKLAIDCPYLLVNRIVLHRAANGEIHYPPLWAKDLILHTAYLKNLSLCCPVSDSTPPTDYVSSSEFPELAKIRVTALLPDVGWGQVVRHFLPNMSTIRKEVAHAEIVHSGAAGWPFPASYYLLLMRAKRPTWLMNVESTFWLVHENEKAGFLRRFASAAHLKLVRKCLLESDLPFFTSQGYRDLLLPSERQGFVVPATWIDSAIVQSDSEVEGAWKAKLMDKRPSRFIFPARLEAEKGVFVLFQAIERLNREGAELQIDFMGTGRLEQECRRFVSETRGSVSLRFIEQVPYGSEFFSTIKDYDGLLVPSLSAEQPRIVFDSYSQGIPVIGADTVGIREVVQDGTTGVLFAKGDAEKLKAALLQCSEDRAMMADLGRSALGVAQRMTHAAMHVNRAQVLRQYLQE